MIRYLSVLLLFLLPCSVQAQQPARPKTDYRATGAPLPPLKLQNDQGRIFTNAGLKPGKPVMLMIFSPECDHCLHMLDSLQGMAPLLSGRQLVLVTEARHKEAFAGFRKGKGADLIRQFAFSGWDAGNLIYHIYTYQLLPQINLYDGRHRLRRSFAGNFPLDSLKMFLP